MTMHILYGETSFKKVGVPRGCRKVAFTHIGYSDEAASSDIYTKWGATIAPTRIPATLKGIEGQGAAGFQAYSEGVFDDINKAILAGLASGKAKRVLTILKHYAGRYFGGDSDAWSEWLGQWGDRRKVDIKRAERDFNKLAREAKPGWRLEQLRSKVQLEKLDRRIGQPAVGEWTTSKQNLVDQFWAAQEHLQRNVYHLGPVRHVFARKFHGPVWYDSWMQATARKSDREILPPEA